MESKMRKKIKKPEPISHKEILLVVDAVSNEKDVPREIIFEALEEALAYASKKNQKIDMHVRVAIDRETGTHTTYRQWLIVEDGEMESFTKEITIEAAQALEPEKELGDFIEDEIESVEFGRIGAQAAKQVIVQKVREAERKRVIDAYEDKVGKILFGVVRRVDRNGAFLDLGDNVEAFIPREKMIPREAIRVGDRVRGILDTVRGENKGPVLFLSRISSAFLVELFRLEVPEIGQDVIQIHGAARDPGARAKIAVSSDDPRLDPVGACVGMRGSRVQTVSNELSGERVDIILWNETPGQFVINALAPAEVLSITVDEENKTMDVAVENEKLALAIGKGGQNIRLASEVTGWRLNIMDAEEAEEKSQKELAETIAFFTQQLDVDEDIAKILADEGFTTVEEVAYVPEDEMCEIEAFDEDIVAALKERAQDALLTSALALEEEIGDVLQLSELEGITDEEITKLNDNEINIAEDLAELSVDEVVELGFEAEWAAKMILAARKPWFEAENETEQ